MANAAGPSPHTFHIPVMGTGFMIDAPLRVAKYGISSVLSLVDDVLIEQMRQYHCQKNGEPYEEIGNDEEDARARRITAYLNLLDLLVRRQVERAASVAVRGRQRNHPLLRAVAGVAASADEYRAMLATDRRRPATAASGSAPPARRARQHRREHHVEGRPRPLPQRRKAAGEVQRRFGGIARFRQEHACVVDRAFGRHQSPPVQLRRRVRRLLPRRKRPAEEEDHSEGKRLPLGRGSGAIFCEARAVGVGISRRVGLELRRTYLRHPGALCSARSWNSSRGRSRNLSSNCTRRASRPWPSAADRRDKLPPRCSHHRARRHRHRRGRPAAARTLRRRRHRLGNAVPAGARGHERRRRASSETVRGRPTTRFI